MRPPLVHVLIINWNGLEHLEACFASLLESPCPNVRYVLVDNASTDGSVAYVRETFGADPRVEVLELAENLGWSGGNNAGIRRALDAGADYVFLLNNDTATEADAIAHLLRMAEERPEAGALAPKMLMFDVPEILNSIGLICTKIGAAWDRGIGRLDGPAWDTPLRVPGVCGGAMFLRASTLEKTGLLPEEFGIYLDDLDLCLRIIDAGAEIWTCPEARVRHKFSASMGAGTRARHKYYLNTRNRFWVLLRNFPAGQLLARVPALVHAECRAVGRAVLDGAWGQATCHLRAWCAAVAYLPHALRHRRAQRQRGFDTGSFWPLIDQAATFCPAIHFPTDGWYAERVHAGRMLRPMARRARLDISGGGLRVFHGNCYPSLGETRVRVTLNGEVVAELSSSGLDVAELHTDAGLLEFHAETIFCADDTGEAADFGGWIALETNH